jgi:putative Holliday junction resolvase
MTNPQLQPQPHRRLLALDPGERRIGVAVSDELGMFAHTRPAIHVRSQQQVVGAVEELVASEAISEVIIGLPLTMAGERAHQANAARKLVEALRGALQVSVREWDERLSSAQAARTVRGDERRKSGALDSAAAAVVLQAVLDSRRARAES